MPIESKVILLCSGRSIPDKYAQKLVEEGLMTDNEVEEICRQQSDYFNSELHAVESYQPESSFYFQKQWEGFVQAPKEITIWDTGMSWDILGFIGRSSVYYPPDFVS